MHAFPEQPAAVAPFAMSEAGIYGEAPKPSEFDGPSPAAKKPFTPWALLPCVPGWLRNPRGAMLLCIATTLFAAIIGSIVLALLPAAPLPPPPPPPLDYCEHKATDGRYDYASGFVGQRLGISKAAYFTVAAASDARVAFFVDKADIRPRAEIILSGWDNTQSVIRDFSRSLSPTAKACHPRRHPPCAHSAHPAWP